MQITRLVPAIFNVSSMNWFTPYVIQSEAKHSNLFALVVKRRENLEGFGRYAPRNDNRGRL